MNDINVQLLDLPPGIHEVVTINEDDSHTIFLNARDSHLRNLQSYKHAIGHIVHHDFDKTDVQQIESAAHI